MWRPATHRLRKPEACDRCGWCPIGRYDRCQPRPSPSATGILLASHQHLSPACMPAVHHSFPLDWQNPRHDARRKPVRRSHAGSSVHAPRRMNLQKLAGALGSFPCRRPWPPRLPLLFRQWAAPAQRHSNERRRWRSRDGRRSGDDSGKRFAERILQESPGITTDSPGDATATFSSPASSSSYEPIAGSPSPRCASPTTPLYVATPLFITLFMLTDLAPETL